MPQTIASIRARFPAFADTTRYPNDLVDLILQETEQRVSPVHFGSVARRDIAVGYLAAHLLSFAPAGSSPASGVQSMTVGQVSVTYGSSTAPSGNPQDMASTAYGRQYLTLARAAAGARII